MKLKEISEQSINKELSDSVLNYMNQILEDAPSDVEKAYSILKTKLVNGEVFIDDNLDYIEKNTHTNYHKLTDAEENKLAKTIFDWFNVNLPHSLYYDYKNTKTISNKKEPYSIELTKKLLLTNLFGKKFIEQYKNYIK